MKLTPHRTFATVALCTFASSICFASGCSSNDRDIVDQSDDALSASEYFGTAGEVILVNATKFDSGTFTVAYWNSFTSADPKTCAKVVRVGSCLIRQGCAVPTGPVALPPVAPIAISAGAASFTLTKQSRFFTDYQADPSPALIPAGTNVHAVAGGITGRIPSFVLDAKMPTPATVTAPDYSNRLAVHRSSPLVVEWTGGSHLVSVKLNVSEQKVVISDVNGERGGTQAGPSSDVECLFPASLGRGAIPASVLGYLPLGEGAAEDVVFTAPIGTLYKNVSFTVESESHAIRLSADRGSPALGELIVSASKSNTSNVDIVP